MEFLSAPFSCILDADGWRYTLTFLILLEYHVRTNSLNCLVEKRSCLILLFCSPISSTFASMIFSLETKVGPRCALRFLSLCIGILWSRFCSHRPQIFYFPLQILIDPRLCVPKPLMASNIQQRSVTLKLLPALRCAIFVMWNSILSEFQDFSEAAEQMDPGWTLYRNGSQQVCCIYPKFWWSIVGANRTRQCAKLRVSFEYRILGGLYLGFRGWYCWLSLVFFLSKSLLAYRIWILYNLVSSPLSQSRSRRRSGDLVPPEQRRTGRDCLVLKLQAEHQALKYLVDCWYFWDEQVKTPPDL